MKIQPRSDSAEIGEEVMPDANDPNKMRIGCEIFTTPVIGLSVASVNPESHLQWANRQNYVV